MGNSTNVDCPELVGHSQQMEVVQQLIQKAAQSRATVLITGESGTGKTIVSNLIHHQSPFFQGPFVVVNCGAIPFNLIESELFGYEKGAFTGALTQKKGKFEQANHGTILLDEIGELSLDAQVKLLRVLQYKEIVRIGGSERISLDVRVIAATNRNLLESIEKATFRIDLFYRIALFLIDLPNLENRKEDIIPLARHFLDKYTKLENRSSLTLSKDAEQFLYNHSWPGNIRQLENCMYRSALMNTDKKILSQNDIMLIDHKNNNSGIQQKLKDGEIVSLQELEAMMIQQALQKTGGNLVEAAKLLQIARSTLYRKIQKHNLASLTTIRST